MGIISVIQVLIKQTADGLGAVIAHIRRLVFYWAWCIHKVRAQLIAADTLPAWNSALMSLLLLHTSQRLQLFRYLHRLGLA